MITYDLYPLSPHFYIVKLGFTRVYIFLIFALKHRLWVPTIYVLSKNKKKITIFHLKIIIITAVKNHCILHGRVFVMVYYGAVSIHGTMHMAYLNCVENIEWLLKVLYC